MDFEFSHETKNALLPFSAMRVVTRALHMLLGSASAGAGGDGALAVWLWRQRDQHTGRNDKGRHM